MDAWGHEFIWEAMYEFSALKERGVMTAANRSLCSRFRQRFEQDALETLLTRCLQVHVPRFAVTIFDLTGESHNRCQLCNLPFVNESLYVNIPCARRTSKNFCSPYCASKFAQVNGRRMYDSLRKRPREFDRMRMFFGCAGCGSSWSSLCSNEYSVFFRCAYCDAVDGEEENDENDLWIEFQVTALF